MRSVRFWIGKFVLYTQRKVELERAADFLLQLNAQTVRYRDLAFAFLSGYLSSFSSCYLLCRWSILVLEVKYFSMEENDRFAHESWSSSLIIMKKSSILHQEIALLVFSFSSRGPHFISLYEYSCSGPFVFPVEDFSMYLPSSDCTSEGLSSFLLSSTRLTRKSVRRTTWDAENAATYAWNFIL